jgi:fumarylacetoacetase
MSWVPIPDGSDFPVNNLAFGVVAPTAQSPRVVVRIGDHALDLAAAGIEPALTALPTTNALLASGKASEVRQRAGELLTGKPRPELLLNLVDCGVLLPLAIGDYVDFYASEHHATNLGKMFRPDTDALLPNWKHLPVGYHGRAGSVVVSGTTIQRPSGLRLVDGEVAFGPSRLLDFELEVGFVVGRSGTRLSPDDAATHVFGVVLLNDWSARDIQSFEYQPLGPHLGKSFGTTISPWIVTLDALQDVGALCTPPTQHPMPADYMRADNVWGLDIDLSVELNGNVVSSVNFSDMYWTFAQMLAHMTVNGAAVRVGDLYGSGTVSGPEKHQRGSMIELSWRGTEPLQLADGSLRSFLQDGDTVTMRASSGTGEQRIGFGPCSGSIAPA